MTVTSAPVEFDPMSEDFFNDPTEVYQRLRDEAPVYCNVAGFANVPVRVAR